MNTASTIFSRHQPPAQRLIGLPLVSPAIVWTVLKPNHMPFALILLLAVSGLAQEPQTDRVFMDSVRVEVVNVEVFVTDKVGIPV